MKNSEQDETFPEQDTHDPTTYVSSLKTVKIKAELNKRSTSICIHSQGHGKEPIERSIFKRRVDKRGTALLYMFFYY